MSCPICERKLLRVESQYRFLTTDELAVMLRLSPRTIENMRLDGRGPAYLRFGKSGKAAVRYRLADVSAWLDKWHIDERTSDASVGAHPHPREHAVVRTTNACRTTDLKIAPQPRDCALDAR